MVPKVFAPLKFYCILYLEFNDISKAVDRDNEPHLDQPYLQIQLFSFFGSLQVNTHTTFALTLASTSITIQKPILWRFNSKPRQWKAILLKSQMPQETKVDI